MYHKNGFKEADDIFDTILKDGHEFGGEAYYYKACMRMRNFDGVRKEIQSLKLKEEHAFKENIDEAIEYFYKARTLFLRRLQRKHNEAAIVTQMMEKLPVNCSKSSGFASQLKSATTYIQLILTNIDYLLGAPCHPKMFADNEISEAYSKEIYDSLSRQGLVSPVVLTGRSADNWQLETFRRKYKLHGKQIETLINEISKDPTSLAFNDYIVLDRASLLDKCPLSTKSDFWFELKVQQTLYNADVYLMIIDQSVLSKELLEKFKQLKPYSLTDPKQIKTLLRYSDETKMDQMYKLRDVEALLEKNETLKSEIYQHVDKGKLKLDKLANVLIIPERMSYFSDFDGVTIDDIKEYFHVDDDGVKWIMSILQQNEILKLQTVQMTRLTSDQNTWQRSVRSHLEKDAKPPAESARIELKLLYQNAGRLQQIKDHRKLVNVTEEVIAAYCEVPSKPDKEETIKRFYTY
ncbi:unnamed protein product, partial [Adineta ricciae]